MPRLLIHAFVGIPASFLVAYMSGPLAGLIFLRSSLLVDIDHLFGHYVVTKDWTRNVRNEYVNMSKRWKKVSVVPSGELEPKYLHWQFFQNRTLDCGHLFCA